MTHHSYASLQPFCLLYQCRTNALKIQTLVFSPQRYFKSSIFSLNSSITNSTEMTGSRLTKSIFWRTTIPSLLYSTISPHFVRFWNVSTRSTCSYCISTICWQVWFKTENFWNHKNKNFEILNCASLLKFATDWMILSIIFESA